MIITALILISQTLSVIAYISFQKQKELWFEDISSSVISNINGKCLWSYESKHNLWSKDIDFFISHEFPSLQELKSFQELTPSLNRGNKNLLRALKNEHVVKWANEIGARWMIPDDHPGQDRSLCMNLTHKLGDGQTMSIYESYKAIITKAVYTVHAKNAIIYYTGAIELECGSFDVKEGSETRYVNSKGTFLPLMSENNLTWNQMYSSLDTYSKVHLKKTYDSYEERAAIRYKRVFVISIEWDTNYYHFITESALRLIRHLDFLLENPDIMIHIRNRNGNRTYVDKNVKFRYDLLNLLGFEESRIISGTILANRVYLPRAASYSFALGNPTEIILLAKTLSSLAKKRLEQHTESKEINPLIYQADDIMRNASRKNLVILHREDEKSWGKRNWDSRLYKRIEKVFQAHFPDHYIIHHASSFASKPSYCYLCTIDELSRADVLVGMHGAGLTNQIFMPLGGLVVEMSQYFNDVHMPICGHYSNLAPICGHHFYSYNWAWSPKEDLDVLDLGIEVAKYYKYLHSK
jgi:hypothetical protein